ncbi:hypothetical protein ACQ86D_27355 [Streptomyces galilaeus]
MQFGGEVDAADVQTGQQKQRPGRPSPAEPDAVLPGEGVVQVAFVPAALHEHLAVVDVDFVRDEHLHCSHPHLGDLISDPARRH